MKPEIIVALDVPSAKDIPSILDSLSQEITFYKIGLELFTAEGLHSLAPLKQRNLRIFLDLKLHDIPRTVANAVKSAARHEVTLLTIHASGGRAMMEAAAEAAKEIGPHAPKLIAVTTLTSLGPDDLPEIGITRTITEHTIALGKLAIECGINGIVCSPLEAAQFRKELGNSPILVTPGIRPSGSDLGDQKRVATPKTASEAGADFLVVGRPIVQAKDRRQAALDIISELE